MCVYPDCMPDVPMPSIIHNIHTYIRMHIHASTLLYCHTYLQKYIHTYIHAHIYMYRKYSTHLCCPRRNCCAPPVWSCQPSPGEAAPSMHQPECMYACSYVCIHVHVPSAGESATSMYQHIHTHIHACCAPAQTCNTAYLRPQHGQFRLKLPHRAL
jgi:hypothetical protein